MSYNFVLKSYLWLKIKLARFQNQAYDFRPNCTSLGIFIIINQSCITSWYIKCFVYIGNDFLLSPRYGSLLITLRQNRSEKRGELCCRITMVATISTIFLDRDDHCFFNQWKKNMNYCLVPECNHAKKSHTLDFFSAIFAEPHFVEIQKSCYHGNVT